MKTFPVTDAALYGCLRLRFLPSNPARSRSTVLPTRLIGLPPFRKPVTRIDMCAKHLNWSAGRSSVCAGVNVVRVLRHCYCHCGECQPINFCKPYTFHSIFSILILSSSAITAACSFSHPARAAMRYLRQTVVQRAVQQWQHAVLQSLVDGDGNK